MKFSINLDPSSTNQFNHNLTPSHSLLNPGTQVANQPVNNSIITPNNVANNLIQQTSNRMQQQSQSISNNGMFSVNDHSINQNSNSSLISQNGSSSSRRLTQEWQGTYPSQSLYTSTASIMNAPQSVDPCKV